MKKLIAFAVFTVFFQVCRGQVISGKITDAKSGEVLPGATLSIVGEKGGAVTNENGNYQLKVTEQGQYTLKASFVGYESMSKEVTVSGKSLQVNFALLQQQQLLDPVNISAIRASDKAPIAQTTLSKADIKAKDEGRDVPFILKDMPSTIVSSDAGTGIGYTGIRIRGSDANAINVTINGISLNDPESHGTYWVDVPDLAASTNSLQVQRGVGTSTNGAGAFGASINFKTNGIHQNPYAHAELIGGSFNTLKTNLSVGSGLLNDHWEVEARLSKITSDGYIDRASTDLRSYYLSASYYSKNTSVQLIHFAGHEKTYQSWWGIPQSRLNGDVPAMKDYIVNNGLDSSEAYNLLHSNSRTYNYYTYDNQTDNYWQDHYQLHFSHRFNNSLKVAAALHYTWGRGYYEEYHKGADMAHYGLTPLYYGGDTIIGADTINLSQTISNSDLISRRWLNNGFTGATYSIEYNKNNFNVTLGGAYNTYNGGHYGEVIWARHASNSEIRDRYYDNNSIKTDLNTYLKANYDLDKLSIFVDLQDRYITYNGQGIDEDQLPVTIDKNFSFFNPKGGLSYSLNEKSRVYASVAVAQREPVRSDYLDAPQKEPQSEYLTDYEAGYELDGNKAVFNANLYYMDYKNQLVITGELNDVGDNIRINVPESYRAGIELSGKYQVTNWFNVGANLTLSQNKIKNYTYLAPVYDDSGIFYDTLNLSSTDIAFSPNVIGGISFAVRPFKNFDINWNTKYVSKQYMDNTSNDNRSLDPYTVTDLRFSYSMQTKWFKNLQFNLLVANLFSELYEPNGATYHYGYTYTENGQKQTAFVNDNYYYPMATRNFMAGIKLDF